MNFTVGSFQEEIPSFVNLNHIRSERYSSSIRLETASNDWKTSRLSRRNKLVQFSGIYGGRICRSAASNRDFDFGPSERPVSKVIFLSCNISTSHPPGIHLDVYIYPSSTFNFTFLWNILLLKVTWKSYFLFDPFTSISCKHFLFLHFPWTSILLDRFSRQSFFVFFTIFFWFLLQFLILLLYSQFGGFEALKFHSLCYNFVTLLVWSIFTCMMNTLMNCLSVEEECDTMGVWN